MADSNLNALRIQQIKGLHMLSPTFRNELDKLVDGEINKAKTLISQLSKLSLDGTGDEKPVNAPVKRGPGRPKGSVSKTPNKPRVKREVVTEPVIEGSVVTHKVAIASALTGNADGLSASDILNSITAAKHKRYTPPKIQTLYTTLHGMKAKGILKMLGDKPHTRYILA